MICILWCKAVWIFLLGIKLVESEDDDDFGQDGSSSFESTDDLEQAWKHCSKWSKSIEVFYKKDDEDKKVLAKVHYRFYPTVSAADSAVWLCCVQTLIAKYFEKCFTEAGNNYTEQNLATFP